MFESTREDGRSHQQVLIDAVHKEPPGTMFTYEQLQGLLGLTKRERARSVVLAAQHRLLKEFSRTMENVRGEGYRMVEASAHARLAKARKRRSEEQLRKGLHLMHNVRWDEMDTEARNAHQGTMMIMDAIYQMQVAQNKRMERIEQAIQNAGIG